jgi:2-C-methyl-D-erythritol 4-phosphate cytidylyltransferase/2-C-methyl-D-erythritol 2,4-cyclodiphosphate synthase
MSVGVIIVAAGRGDRLGTGVPKQFVVLGGRSMLGRSVDAFDRHEAIAEIVVVLPADRVRDALAIVGATSRPLSAVAGGASRHESVRAGFLALSPGVEVVLVHDAARPFVSAGLIDRVVAAAREGAVVPAVPARDTIKRASADGAFVESTVDRQGIWLAQTPQGFPRAVLADAIARTPAGSPSTDEAVLVEALGGTVRIVMGDEDNVKVTTPADLVAARARVEAPRVGTGYDLHRLAAGRPLVLAGCRVPFDRGPDGHSDGDVVCHAIVDALFGAAGAGDIGQWFPPSDPAWKDAPGLDLLARARDVIRSRGWRVASVDCTVLLEQPRLAPVVPAVRAALAATLAIAEEAVGVKAKTNEGVDAVGRGDAIAAHAVAVLVPGPAS